MTDGFPTYYYLYIASRRKISLATAKILTEFLANPAGDQYGFALMKATGLASGSLYPILDRLETMRWIEGFDEPIDEWEQGRPRRRLYRLTPDGEAEAPNAVDEFVRDVERLGRWAPA